MQKTKTRKYTQRYYTYHKRSVVCNISYGTSKQGHDFVSWHKGICWQIQLSGEKLSQYMLIRISIFMWDSISHPHLMDVLSLKIKHLSVVLSMSYWRRQYKRGVQGSVNSESTPLCGFFWNSLHFINSLCFNSRALWDKMRDFPSVLWWGQRRKLEQFSLKGKPKRSFLSLSISL